LRLAGITTKRHKPSYSHHIPVIKFHFWNKLAVVDGSMISHQNNTSTVEACSCISQNIGATTLTTKQGEKLEENAHDGY
jgi:hypothetical protein